MSIESHELYAALEHTPPETPVWVECHHELLGYLVKSVDHEEVGIVLRLHDDAGYRVSI